MSELWYTKAELARKLRISPKSVQRHIRPTMVVGKQNRYEWSDVLAQRTEGNVVRLRPEERAAA